MVMKLKKGILWLVILAGVTVLAACDQQAPNLSFEETIKAYGEQKSPILSVLDLISDKEAIFSSKLNWAINLELGTGEVGKIVVNSTNVSERKTENQESDVNLQLELSSQEALMGTAVDLTADLGVKALIKDYIPYFQLSKLDIKANDNLKDQLSFVTSMVDGFKGKWFTLSWTQLKDLATQMNAQKFVFTGAFMQDKVEYYTGVESVEYEWQPAWKVQFNEDLVKADAKEALRAMFSGANLSWNTLSGNVDFTGSLLFMEDQQKLTQIENMIDSMKFENLEAYFVIYAKDNIKFVIKSGDLIINDEIKISFSQKVTLKSYEGTITVTQLMSGENFLMSGEKLLMSGDNLSGEVHSLTFDYAVKASGWRKVVLDLSVLDGEDEQLKLSGTLAFEMEENALSVKPDINLEIKGARSSVAGEYRMEKIDSYTFTEPKDAQDFATLLGAFFAGPELSDELLSWESLGE